MASHTKQITKRLFRGYEETLAALVSRILSLVKSRLLTHDSMVKAMDDVQMKLDVLNKVIVRSLKGKFTQQIAAADRERNNQYRALVLRIESDKLSTRDLAIQAGAAVLDKILAAHGKFPMGSYIDQTFQIESLLKKFNAPDIAEILNETHLQPLVDHLSITQDAFRQVWTKSVDENSRKVSLTIRNTSDALVNAVNRNLFKRLDIGAEDEGAPFDSVIALINTALDETHRVQRSRLSRSDVTEEPILPPTVSDIDAPVPPMVSDTD